MKTSNYYLKLIKLSCILLFSIPVETHAITNLVACFESYNKKQILLGEDEKANLASAEAVKTITRVSDQDCIIIKSVGYSFEQSLNIGSQSSGVGAGKVTFNPVTIIKSVDLLSPEFFQRMASGTPFKSVNLFLIKNNPDSVNKNNYSVFMMIQLGLVAIQKLESTFEDGGVDMVTENLTLEYGKFKLTTFVTDPVTGQKLKTIEKGWDRVKNVSLSTDSDIPDLKPQ